MRTDPKARRGHVAAFVRDQQVAFRLATAYREMGDQFPARDWGPERLAELSARQAKSALSDVRGCPKVAAAYLARAAALAILALERLEIGKEGGPSDAR